MIQINIDSIGFKTRWHFFVKYRRWYTWDLFTNKSAKIFLEDLKMDSYMDYQKNETSEVSYSWNIFKLLIFLILNYYDEIKKIIFIKVGSKVGATHEKTGSNPGRDRFLILTLKLFQSRLKLSYRKTRLSGVFKV